MSRQLIALLVGTSMVWSGCNSPDEAPVDESLEEVVGEAHHRITCSEHLSETGDPRLNEFEIYDLTAMNRNLESDEDLKAFAGIDEVENCEEAREFSRKKTEYEDGQPPAPDTTPLAPSPEEPPASDRLEDHTRIFHGLTSGGTWGVVRIMIAEEDPGTGSCTTNEAPCAGCTGFMINDTTIVTAAHCLTPFTTTDHSYDWFNIDYYVGGGFRNVTSGWDYLEFYIDENYTGTGDTKDDIGVVIRNDGWEGCTNQDYVRLHRGGFGYIEKGKAYGYGVNKYSSTGWGVLRKGWLDVDWVGTNHFYNLADYYGMCDGDSGGPIYTIQNNRWLVLGLLSNVNTVSGQPDSKVCAYEGVKQRWVRMNDNNIDWIEEKTGVTCTNYHTDVGSIAYNYARCW